MFFTADDRARLDRIEQALAQVQATLNHLPSQLAPTPTLPPDAIDYEPPPRVDEADEEYAAKQRA